LSQAATEAKTVAEFKDALQLIWSTLPQTSIIQRRERLSQATVGMCGHYEHKM